MTQLVQKSRDLLKEMLENIEAWSEDLKIEESIDILEKHSRLMINYQEKTKQELSEKEINKIQTLIDKSKKLMDHLEAEKVDLFEKISQMNQSGKIATQYIKQFSESYFIDKDF